MPNTNAQRRKDAAAFAALDGTRCPTCKCFLYPRVKRINWSRNQMYRAEIVCHCVHFQTAASTRYRAVAKALAAYRAAGRAGE